jgi:capsular exopolysaccharide synthesis family protein
MKQLLSGAPGETWPLRTIPLPRYRDAEDLDISFTQIFRTLRKRKWIIATFAILTTLLAWEVSVYMTPKYEAVAFIEVNKEAADMLGDAMSSMMQRGNGAADSLDYNITLQTHTKALQSDSLTFQVADQLNLENRREFRLVPPWLPWFPPGESMTQAKIETEYRKTLDRSPRRRALLSKVFSKNLTVKSVPGTRLIKVRFLSPDPQVAADVVNKLIADYLEQYFRTRYTATAQASERLSNDLSGLLKDVETGERKLGEAQKQAGLLGIGDGVHSIEITRLDALTKQLTEAEGTRIMAEVLNRIVKTGNPELISTALAGSGMTPGASPNPLGLLQTLRTQEAQLKMQYAQASTKYGLAFPALVQVRNQLADLDSSIQTELDKLSARTDNAYQAARASEDQLRESFGKEKAVAERLNDFANQFTIQKHEAEVNRSLYDTLLAKLKGAGILSGLQSTNVVVIDPARTTPKPARPNYPLNLAIGLGVGLLSGIALAFIKESTDNTLRTSEEVEEIASLPTLCVVPDFRPTRLPSMVRRKEAHAWAVNRPGSAGAEAYRLLRTSLLFSNIDNPPKVIVVTSALPNDGKSTTSVNMATTFGQQGYKVLLVDADLRRPKLKGDLSLNSNGGLTDLLLNGDTDGLSYQTHPHIPSLSLLTSGRKPPNPAELLGTIRMGELIAEWRERFDFVIIDTPPVLAVSDPLVLAQYADAAIFVVCYNKTTKQSLVRARDLLMRANTRISGVVMNRMNTHSSDHYASHGYNAQQKGYYNDARN